MNVYTQESNIPNIGKGLFAAKDFEKDELIVEYLGEVTPPGQEPKNHRSNLYFNDGSTLCCFEDDLASFANDCINAPTEVRKLTKSLRKSEPFYKRFPTALVNAEIHLEQDSHKAFLYSRAPIKKDEEIFCHYGFLYWFNYETLNIGFEMEKEVEKKGFPDNIFRYNAFHAYVKEFYPDSRGIEVAETENGFAVAVKFEGKGMILNMPRISKMFANLSKVEM